MNGEIRCKEPSACSEHERREFARLVLRGFDSARDTLLGRIRDAKCLAFYYVAGDTLGAIAALKAPKDQYRTDLFKKADARVSPADYRLELGWIFVDPAYRGRRIAGRLCRDLLARVPRSRVFATTRTDNDVMARILDGLGFVRAGKSYPRRDEQLVLFLRSPPTSDAPDSSA